MTLMNLTITADRIAISSDTAIADPVGAPLEGAASTDPLELPKDFAEPSRPVFPPAIAMHRRKIAILPERRRIVAASGMALLTVFAAGFLALWGEGSIEQEVGELAAELSKLREILPSGAASGMVIVGAYEDDLGAAAFMLGSGEGWHPRRLRSGTASVPTPCPTLKGYGELYKRCAGPPGGDVESLHLALAQNQAEAARRGLYRTGPAIGGDLWLAEVDRDGARQGVIGRV